MAPMAAQAVISWRDPKNFCTVSRAENCGEELLLVLCTEGAEYAPEEAEVTTPGPTPLRLTGRKRAATWRPCENCQETLPWPERERTEVTLAFDCPPLLQCAEDVLFSYAPGYSCVSVLDLILSSLVQPRSQPGHNTNAPEELEQEACNPSADWPPRPSSPVAPWAMESGTSKPQREAWPLPLKPSSSPHATACNLISYLPESSHINAVNPQVLRPLQPQQLASEPSRELGKCEESMALTGPAGQSSAMELRPSSHALSVPASASSCEAFFSSVDAGHVRTTPTLERRLAELCRLRRLWEAGDSRGLAEALEASRDDALLYGALQILGQRTKPWPPRVLARFLPLAQRLSQSSSETHAVVAMRFAIRAIDTSWPAVARALQNVATPKATFDDCQAAVRSVSALFQVIKTMSRSVRISLTNGPLIPVCKELKASLEKALGAVGRRRGSC